MQHAVAVIKKVAAETDSVIIFHSAAGKDSIAMLDLAHPYFKRIVCCYMYVVKHLEHIDKYIIWAKNKYPKCEFIEVPHFVLSQYVKFGYLGCKKDSTQRVYQLNNIVSMTKKNTGIDWAFIGFKQSDNLNRRLQLRTYEDNAIYRNTKNAYPLSAYSNQDIERYIKLKKLIPPIKYGYGASQGTDISSPIFLKYCKDYYPNDYQRIIKEFPQAQRIEFEFEYDLKNEN
ncbi:MAG: phosphoadenosine phosphosulfate reductase family protein [Prevotellaceae bacterium]|jgi:3'-phosphoadenosine 5'-phosphosulfate sulfotransferase (PAPS reductase)/FAD synthetase|nr:phosphoadenosine phosphosulfate reductase family protein [Prevotellaceae bacterium]